MNTMKLFKTEEERQIATLQQIEKQIERRERVHKLLIAGLATLLATSLVCHLIPGKKHHCFGKK